jgi:hypothetical protein
LLNEIEKCSTVVSKVKIVTERIRYNTIKVNITYDHTCKESNRANIVVFRLAVNRDLKFLVIFYLGLKLGQFWIILQESL